MGKKSKGGPKRTFKKDPVATKMATGVKKTTTKPVVIDRKRVQFRAKARTEVLNCQLEQMRHLKQQQTKAGKVERAAAGGAAAREEAKRLCKSETKMPPTGSTHEAREDSDSAMEELKNLSML